jgi:hypothetical protein
LNGNKQVDSKVHILEGNRSSILILEPKESTYNLRLMMQQLLQVILIQPFHEQHNIKITMLLSISSSSFPMEKISIYRHEKYNYHKKMRDMDEERDP